MGKIKEQFTTTFLIFLVTAIYLIFFLQIANNQKIVWQVKVGDFRIGGHNYGTAQNILEKEWNTFAEEEIVLNYEDKNWSIKLNELGFNLDYNKIINYAYQIGHRDNQLANLKEQISAFLGMYNIEPAYQLNQEKFMEKTLEIFSNVERPAQNANLEYNSEIRDFSLIHSTEGTTIDRKDLLSQIDQRIKGFSNQPINLTLIYDYPTVENNEIELAYQKANQILQYQPYYLTYQNDRWIINQKRILDWIEFKPAKEKDSNNEILEASLNQKKIKEYLETIAQNIDRPYTNAQLEIEEGKAIKFSSPKEGFEVKMDQTFNQLIKNLTADYPIRTTAIIADKSSPKIFFDQINDLGINELIGQGTSNFSGSPNNRRHNIKVGVAKLNGIVLEPNQEFSFNQMLGQSGPEEGYLPELVIKNNRTIPEYGGGLCQVSTTIFRAALYSGMEIIERRSHAFPVVYYAPHGFDATVYDPKPDFRFLNDTPGHLLIEAFVDGNEVIFNFYGTKIDQEVKILGPYILESNEDGSMKTVVTQEVLKDGQLFYRRSFYSNYDSPDDYADKKDEKEIEEE